MHQTLAIKYCLYCLSKCGFPLHAISFLGYFTNTGGAFRCSLCINHTIIFLRRHTGTFSASLSRHESIFLAKQHQIVGAGNVNTFTKWLDLSWVISILQWAEAKLKCICDNVSHSLLTANVLEWIWCFKWPEKQKRNERWSELWTVYLHYFIWWKLFLPMHMKWLL